MSGFTRFFIDPGITIKEEPHRDDISIMNNTTASVPIPTRRGMEMPDYRDFGIEIDNNSQSPLFPSNGTTLPTHDGFDNTTMWGKVFSEEALKTEALIHMDDDDIFQVDKADLIQGPTLAELNANDETLLGDLNFDDLLLPEEGYLNHQKIPSPFLIHNSNNHLNNNIAVTAASSCPQSSMLFCRELDMSPTVPSMNGYDGCGSKTMSPYSPASSNSPLLQSSPLHNASSIQQKHSTLHELLMRRESYNSPERVPVALPPKQNTPTTSPPNVRLQKTISRLSSSAPTHLGLAELWQRREPRKHLLSTGSLAEAGSTSSLSTGGVLSPDPPDFSHDELDSEDESDGDHQYEDVSSDNGKTSVIRLLVMIDVCFEEVCL